MTDKVLLKKLREKYGDEEVLVCQTSLTKKIPDRFSPWGKTIYSDFARLGWFIRRSDAEYNLTFMQLVGYVVVCDADEENFFVSQRISGDERLKGQYSFFGGHVSPCDMGPDTVLNAATRELDEELYGMLLDDELQFMGMVRDNAGPTSEHLGVVFKAHAMSAQVKETDKLKGIWMSKSELFSHYNDFEAWGRYIIDYLYEEMINARKKEEA